MDKTRSVDPYEQQLFTLFTSYDCDHCGSLTSDSLVELCRTLQLEEEQTKVLVKDLIADDGVDRVTFEAFKVALLTLLTSIQSKAEASPPPCSSSSVAVVVGRGATQGEAGPTDVTCPKYVYGQKRYGRRTRPKVGDNTNELDDIHFQQQHTSQGVCGGDVASSSGEDTSSTVSTTEGSTYQSEVLAKKRRSDRTAASNGRHHHHDLLLNDYDEEAPPPSEDLLREAWRKLGIAHDGYLNRTELLSVCTAIGLPKLAETVLEYHSRQHHRRSDDIHQISIADVLDVLRQDDIWTTNLLLSTSTTSSSDSCTGHKSTANNDSLVTNTDNDSDSCSDTLKPTTTTTATTNVLFQSFNLLGPKGGELISVDVLAEIWENAGIAAAKELVRKLGFDTTTSDHVNVVDLTLKLHQELNNYQDLDDGTLDNCPEEARFKCTLLQANLCLHQIELQYLNHVLEQMCSERDKLRGDLLEANNRAKLLALEIDDNHARMETRTTAQVRQLDQRHSDTIKTLERQHASDKEQLLRANQTLEDRIVILESDLERCKVEVEVAHSYTTSADKENHSLAVQLEELKGVRQVLAEQIASLEGERQRFVGDLERDQIEPLLKQLAAVHMENTQLRDTNDEMLAQIETLQKRSQRKSPEGAGADVKTDDNDVDVNSTADKRDGGDLQGKCRDLEQCIELLRNEYDECEDYWQNRLTEERNMFEQEQTQHSEKLNEVLTKMAEYEQQFTNQTQLLAPIEETDELEKQFTDLEQEFDEYRQMTEIEVFRKDEEIANLRCQLLVQQETTTTTTNNAKEVGVQATVDVRARIGAFSVCVAESTNVLPTDTQPQSTKDCAAIATVPLNNASSRPIRHVRKAHGGGDYAVYKGALNQRFAATEEEKQMLPSDNTLNVTVPLSSVQGLNERLHHLEQRCRQLQLVLKQQHFYTEQSLHNCYQRHSGEKAELQGILRHQQEKLCQQIRTCNEQLERLTRNDMLVKELYVENSYLVSKIQRLEQQCNFLAQCNNGNSSRSV